MGRIIDVDFGPGDRSRWCRRCDEPCPESTALCPRCGGELVSASVHRAEVRAATGAALRRLGIASGLGIALFVAVVLWLWLR